MSVAGVEEENTAVSVHNLSKASASVVSVSGKESLFIYYTPPRDIIIVFV